MQGRAEKIVKTAGIAIFWLLVWQLLALVFHNSILLSGPLEVLIYLKQHILTASFWKTVGNSFFHIFTGFAFSFIAGFFMGILSAKYHFLESLLSPFLQFVKAVPVASFVVLLLIFIGSAKLSVSVTFLMVLPIIYQNVLEGVKNTDRSLLEMAQVFRMPLWNRIFFIYRPSLMPFLISGSKVALGMSFKAGVAAEVIGTPDFSIGERIYMSKIFLDTAGLFSWTFVVILISFLFERIFLGLLVLVGNAQIKAVSLKTGQGKQAGISKDGIEKNKVKSREGGRDIIVEDMAKYYSGKKVFCNLSQVFEGGGIYAVMGGSGCGKTTLFRILLGLTDYDKGNLRIPKGRCGVVFQEDRLCIGVTPVKNVSMAAKKGRTEEEIRQMLLEILPEECLDQETGKLSGGMKRRTAIARAMLGGGEWLLLDEPFTGLDEETKKKTIAFILKYRNGRTMLVATHQKEEVEQLSAVLVTWDRMVDERYGKQGK